MKVTVLGAGNGAWALALHMAKLGHDVLMRGSEEYKANLDPVLETGEIEAVPTHNGYTAMVEGTCKIRATTDMKEACEFSDILMMIKPSFGQRQTFELALPYLTDRHIIVCQPGNFFFLEATQVVKEKTNLDVTQDLPFTIVEAVSIPYCCRKLGGNKIFIVGHKKAMHIGVYPASRSIQTQQKIQPFFELKLPLLNNAIEAGFYNPNIILHSAILIYNAGWVESKKGNFYFYKEGVTEGVCRIMEALDKERRQVAKAMGLELTSMLTLLKSLYEETSSQTFFEYFRDGPQYDGIKAPSTLNTRYITEDFNYLFLPIFQDLAQTYNVPTPIATSVANSAKVLSGLDIKSLRDFDSYPRSLSEVLGSYKSHDIMQLAGA